MNILALNCWTTSVTYQLCHWDRRQVLARGIMERVTMGETWMEHEVPGREIVRFNLECPDLRSAIEQILATLSDPQHGVIADISAIDAVGHRVVHGGERFTHSVMIDDQVMEAIHEAEHLAPQHNSNNIAGIVAAQQMLPNIPHVAIFDTAFHQTMPERAFIYPLPYDWYERYGVRRYGFHGTSHLYAAKRAAVMLGKPAAECNLISIHLGKGSSLCAIASGVSVDTSMGLTPVEGAMMGTRSGDIDPGIPPFIMREEDLSPREMDTMLNQKSGILGITGRHKNRIDVLAGEEQGDERCRLALDMECYRLRKYIGAYRAVVGGLDAVVFTGTVGVRWWQLRHRTLAGLDQLGMKLDEEHNRQAITFSTEEDVATVDSPVRILVIPNNEMLVVAEDTAAIVRGIYAPHLQYPYTFSSPDFVLRGTVPLPSTVR